MKYPGSGRGGGSVWFWVSGWLVLCLGEGWGKGGLVLSLGGGWGEGGLVFSLEEGGLVLSLGE